MSFAPPDGLYSMFRDTKAFSGFAADDIAAAQRFYGDTLGIRTSEEHGLLTLHLAGGERPTLVYPKPGHVPAEYTILNFPVDDIEAAVDALTERGVEFERYPEMTQDERGVMREGGPYIAWFKDPAGNVLSVLQER
jgi:catechol 2,3-dioxygenase-like lactoylglutathione lyase family enzyme